MPKVKITIKGSKVHNVGYRVMLVNRALEIGIDHFNTFNTSRDGLQVVIALIEGDEEQLNEVMDFVRTKRPEKAVVSGITDEEYNKIVPPIERCLQSFQMEQWGKGIPVLLEIRDVLHSVKEDTGKMLEKQDSMLEKQDSMLDKQDSMLEKQDALKSAVDHGFSELKEEHIKTREISMEIFRSEVQELRQEINFLRSSVEEIRKKVGIT